MLLAAVQVRVPPLEPASIFESGALTLLRTPVVELLISKKKRLLQVLDDAKYDKIPVVRQTAAAALTEVNQLPDPVGGEEGLETIGALGTGGGASPETQRSTRKSSTQQQQRRTGVKSSVKKSGRVGGRLEGGSSKRCTGAGAEDNGGGDTQNLSSGRLSAR